MKKDAPLYEIEYENGDGYIEIPDEEITEFIKKRLIEIANSPRLLQKYKAGLSDLLEEEIQEYADKQFYTEGRGEVIDSAEEDFTRDVILEYKRLPISVYSLVSHEVLYPIDVAHPAEYEESEIKIEWDFEVDGEEVVTYFYENAEDFDELKDLPEENLEKYIRKNFNLLVEKYDSNLKKYYQSAARKDAEENYEPEEDELY